MGKTTDIRAAVEAELKFDPRVNDADIHVANVNGDVALNGTVPNYPQYLEAAAATQRVSGVITLTGHVHTWAEHDAVVGAAWMARGVVDVNDELQITG